jgi:arginyl-tRNA synthetase
LSTDPVSALAARIGTGVTLERPSDAEHGDYATNAALRLAGARRQAPRDIAAELVETAQALPEVERAETAGPGFVNLFLVDAWFVGALRAILDAGNEFGCGWPERSERVQF